MKTNIYTIANADNTKVICNLFEDDYMDFWRNHVIKNTTTDRDFHIKTKGNVSDTFISDEAYLQQVKSKDLKFISDQVELFDENDDDQEYTRRVFFKEGIFYAISNQDDNLRQFKLLKTVEQLTDTEKSEVLQYCLGHLTGEVDLRDIFLHNTFIEEIN